jgi:chorismate mutase
MSATMPPDTPADMAALRSAIDAIDRDLARLMAQRSGLAAAVADAKRAEGSHGFGWRPAREVAILRTVRVAEPALDPWLAATVWRAMIASNLAAQGGISVVSLVDCAPAARLAFGAASGVTIVANPARALDHVRDTPNAVAVLPAAADTRGSAMAWWALMRAPTYSRLHVCAASPTVDTGQPIEAWCIAAMPPEQAGGDVSLMAGPPQVLSDFGGRVLEASGGLELRAVDGFYGDGRELPSTVRLVGAYALA